MENIGKRIRELRKKNDLTQEKLANYLNVSFQTVSKWENGVNAPDLSFIVPLAKVLHTTTDILLGNAALPEEADKLREKLEDAWKAERYGFQRGREMIAAAEALVNAFPDNFIYRCWMGYALRFRAFEIRRNDFELRRNDSDDWKELLEQALGHYKLVIEDCKEEYWHEEALENTATTLYSATRTVTHDPDGTKTITVKASFDVDTSVRWVYAEETVALPTILRCSTLTAGEFTTGAEGSLTVTPVAEGFTHAVLYAVGDMSGTVTEETAEVYISLATSPNRV